MLNSEIIAQNLRFRAAITEIIETCTDFDFVFFKGAGFILKNIYRIDERQFSDIDILVKPKFFTKFCECLEKKGYAKYIEEKIKPNAVVYRRGNVMLDIHRSIFNFTNFPFNHFPGCVLVDGLITYNENHLLDNDMEFVIVILHGLFSLFREERWFQDVSRFQTITNHQNVIGILDWLGFKKTVHYLSDFESAKITALKICRIIFISADNKISFVSDLFLKSKKILYAKGYKSHFAYYLKIAKDLRKRHKLTK